MSGPRAAVNSRLLSSLTIPVVLGPIQDRTNFRWKRVCWARGDLGIRSPASPGPTSHSAPLTVRCSDDLRDGPQEIHRVFYIVVITENRKHPSSPERLVSVQKVMEGSELELAKVPVEYQTGLGGGWHQGGLQRGLFLTQKKWWGFISGPRGGRR